MKDELKKLKIGQILFDTDLKKYNTYKVSGNVLAIAYPEDTIKLIILLKYLQFKNIKYKVLGNGSNVIFNDGYDGVLIKLDCFDKLEIDDIKVTVGAGYNLTKLALKVSKMGLAGLDWAVGIPGTVGGAIFMNAGAYKSDMGYYVSDIKVLTPNFEIQTIYNKDLDFHYRTSFLQKNPGYICLEATIMLREGNADALNSVIADRKQRRFLSQPLDFPSAGSVFRNPNNDYAGRLVEVCGWKGKNIGDALVSEKHANFIVNIGNAKGSDIKKLITTIKKDVFDKTNIELQVEQEFIE